MMSKSRTRFTLVASFLMLSVIPWMRDVRRNSR